MEIYHWFWGILLFATLAWYSTVTVFVAFKGVTDIRTMLSKLNSRDVKPTRTDSENAQTHK
jgi:hypothetical protein